MDVSFKQLVKDTIRELAESGELYIGLRRAPSYVMNESPRLVVELVIDDRVVASDYVYYQEIR